MKICKLDIGLSIHFFMKLGKKMSVEERIAEIKERIEIAKQESGRVADVVHLIAVSKTFDSNSITPVIHANQRVFGENRIQESLQKWPGLLEKYQDIELHLIGPLQSNKTTDAIRLFDVIHTVDREKIAKSIKHEMEVQQKNVQLFVQVNTGEESQKSGLLPRNVDDFLTQCRDDIGINIVGLMCIPPFDENPGPHFALLQKIATRNHLQNLSMGMSADYELAIRMGATHVRVGSALFGARNTH